MSAAETVREMMRLSGGDEGAMAAVGLRRSVLSGVRETPAAIDPDEFKGMLKALDQLKLEHSERTRREAAEQQLVERERELVELRARPTAAPLAEPSEQLRAFLAESETQLASARFDLEAAHMETKRVAAEVERLRAELSAAQAVAAATPRERVVYREPALPQEVIVEVVRGTDNRIAALRLRR